MSISEQLVHERTLLGAVDSYLKALVHVRPHLARRYEALLENMTQQWFLDGGPNLVAAIDAVWLTKYVAVATDRAMLLLALSDFYRWASRNGLVEGTHGLSLVMRNNWQTTYQLFQRA